MGLHSRLDWLSRCRSPFSDGENRHWESGILPEILRRESLLAFHLKFSPGFGIEFCTRLARAFVLTFRPRSAAHLFETAAIRSREMIELAMAQIHFSDFCVRD
jgi:hypothetical protein